MAPHAVRTGHRDGTVWLEWRYPRAQNRDCWTLAHTLLLYLCEYRILRVQDYAMVFYHSEAPASVFRFGVPFHLYATAFKVDDPVESPVPESVWKTTGIRSPQEVFTTLCENEIRVAAKLLDMVAACSSHGRGKANFSPLLHNCQTRLASMLAALVAEDGDPPLAGRISNLLFELRDAAKKQLEYDPTGLCR